MDTDRQGDVDTQARRAMGLQQMMEHGKGRDTGNDCGLKGSLMLAVNGLPVNPGRSGRALFAFGGNQVYVDRHQCIRKTDTGIAGAISQLCRGLLAHLVVRPFHCIGLF